jgi:hypothetical protein
MRVKNHYFLNERFKQNIKVLKQNSIVNDSEK